MPKRLIDKNQSVKIFGTSCQLGYRQETYKVKALFLDNLLFWYCRKTVCVKKLSKNSLAKNRVTKIHYFFRVRTS
jgi:hypothetical protein